MAGAGTRTATSRFALVQEDRLRAHGLAEHTRPGEPHLWADRRELPPRPAVGTPPADGQLELVFRDRLDLVIVQNSREGRPGGAWVRLREVPTDVSLAPYALERFRSGRLLVGSYGSGAVS